MITPNHLPPLRHVVRSTSYPKCYRFPHLARPARVCGNRVDVPSGNPLTEEERSMPATPPVRRRLLGTALRGYRESLGFNLDEAAIILACDRSKISRIETGERGIRTKELRELLTEYHVPAAEQEALLAVAHRGRESGWWLDYRDVLSPAAQDYIIMEIAATEILAYEANQVPDLLQTVDYMRAVAAADARYTTGAER